MGEGERLTPKILLPVNDHPAKSGVSIHQTVCEWTGRIAAGELSVIESCIQLYQAISSELALPFFYLYTPNPLTITSFFLPYLRDSLALVQKLTRIYTVAPDELV